MSFYLRWNPGSHFWMSPFYAGLQILSKKYKKKKKSTSRCLLRHPFVLQPHDERNESQTVILSKNLWFRFSLNNYSCSGLERVGGRLLKAPTGCSWHCREQFFASAGCARVHQPDIGSLSQAGSIKGSPSWMIVTGAGWQNHRNYHHTTIIHTFLHTHTSTPDPCPFICYLSLS